MAQSYDSGVPIESGNVVVEVTGTPFDAGSSLLSFGQMRVKYALSEALAIRIGLGIDMANEPSTPDVVTTDFTYEVMPGVEYAFYNEGKIRTYAALEAHFGSRTAQVDDLNGTSVDGSLQIPSGNNFAFSSAYRGYMEFGAGLYAGAECFVTPRFYIGTEIGFKYIQRINSEVTVDGVFYQDQTTSTFIFVDTMNTLKIGFRLL